MNKKEEILDYLNKGLSIETILDNLSHDLNIAAL
jgi:hypothetical protein